VICLRCGYCCKWLSVVIVDGPAKGPVEGNLVFHEGGGKSCKHQRGSEPGKYRCAIHNKRWYKNTPCAHHGQIERSPRDKCRMGVYQLALARNVKKEVDDGKAEGRVEGVRGVGTISV
jgi:hypothetical protein